MIGSPLRYPGGKSRSIKIIKDLVPNFDEFREPFVGGGSMFFYLKQLYPNKKFWINDIYQELMTFWQQSQSNLDEVLIQITQWKNEFTDGKKLFYFLKKNKSTFNKTEIAAMFFVFNRITFSGTTEAGGYSEQAFQKRFTDSSVERLKQIGSVLRKTKITTFDYEKPILENGKNVFLFLDPPYSKNKTSALYGENGKLHKNFDHKRFAEVLKKCSHKWLLTYDNSPYIRELFSFAQIRNWDLTYGMRNVAENSNQKEKELFISNYSFDFAEKKQFSFAFN